MMKRTRALVIGVVAALVVAAVAFVVLGQTEGTATSSRREGLLAKVAANLGVKVEDLVAAFAKARGEMMDEAVAAGRITAEQAQQMKDRIEARQALRDVFAQAIEEGKITQDQLALLRGQACGAREGGLPRVGRFFGRMMGRMRPDKKCTCP